VNIFDVSKVKSEKSIFSYERGFSLTEELQTEDELIANNNLSQSPLSGITNFSVTPETNSFILRWNNPKTQSFSYVAILMSHANTSAGCLFENALPVYVGTAETFTYYLPDVLEGEVSDIPQRDYFRFWISAYEGNILNSKGLEAWQTS